MKNQTTKAMQIVKNAPEVRVNQYIVDTRKKENLENTLASIEGQIVAREKKPLLSPSQKFEVEKQKLARDLAKFELALENAKFAKPGQEIKEERAITNAKTKVCRTFSKMVKIEGKEKIVKEVSSTVQRTAKEIEMDLESDVAKGMLAYFAKKYSIASK